jgi:hypothetical protein
LVVGSNPTGPTSTLSGKTAQYKVSDGEDLYVFVSTSGTRLWRLAYRFNGKPKTLSLGKYPETSLLDARRARGEAKKLITDEIDLSVARKSEKRKKMIAAGGTFQVIAHEWFGTASIAWCSTANARSSSPGLIADPPNDRPAPPP